MLRATLIGVSLLVLSGCDDEKKSHEEAIAYCTAKVAKDHPKAHFDDIVRHTDECMAAEGWDY
ncbi:hypothetical protein [Methyloceanibacter caenitepidi]|uniref:hypothetical protein n=1 Tax=Methyloceanibacter caenitepidi TaxID=1384459 RepID=UPI0005EE2C45|nr:hypothetical protein [Methyloceanibacter caenitepidi]